MLHEARERHGRFELATVRVDSQEDGAGRLSLVNCVDLLLLSVEVGGRQLNRDEK